MNKYRIHGFDLIGDFNPRIEIEADYYKVEDGFLTLYNKIFNPETRVVTHSKIATFKIWSFIETRTPFE